ncbi:MAG: DNA cytosine methyltransferase [Thermus sp.]|uniref:DNA cytosine methyltransferase n=1 Tax=Thermus sp. TaxID=275 RepID=UPI0025CCE8AB|nr:DNA cytosine methyltransferase [Thermus sp.]MCS6868525.1 DNA cytosine methyltransferase [Thermus sp.]MCS7218459.1 DNA cytosine methyltransferase [Thermus sp.]
MSARTLFALLVLLLLFLFSWLNWGEITRPTSLSLGLTRVEAPLGLVLVVALGTVSLLYLLFTIGLETAALLEVKRYARELLHYKKLAEDAEQSRYTELKRYLEAELQRLAQVEKEEIRALEARLAETLEKHGNTLAAYIGELEDQVLRLLGPREKEG